MATIDGDTMVIGAPYDDGMGSISGSAYVFTRVTNGNLGSGWTQNVTGALFDSRSVFAGERMVIEVHRAGMRCSSASPLAGRG